MADLFLNPYHFVPVAADARRTVAEAADPNQTSADHPHTHERYVAGSYSGELVCRLTTVTPIVLGGEQEKVEERQYKDYTRVKRVERKIGDRSLPVIPASSLRGMVGSVLESLTASALRVLDKTAYSVRHYKEEALSALGMVLVRDGKWKLIPLTIPTLDVQRGAAVLPEKWRELFPFPQLRVYYGQRGGPSQGNILSADFPFRSAASEEDFWYLNAPQPERWEKGWSLPIEEVTDSKVSNYKLLGINATGVPSRDANEDEPGYMRVLGCWLPERDAIPTTRKHELFLPVPPKDWPEVPIPKPVVKRFEELTAAAPPFYPVQETAGSHPHTIREGDIVYFDVDQSGNVCEISFSSMWRTRPETCPGTGATAHDFFPPELRPYNPARQSVTRGELMLGFVAEDKHPVLTAFASRLRFSDGLPRPEDPAQQQLLSQPAAEVPLRILASPKPPCPAMYFKPGPNGERIQKSRLDPAKHQPQGRKFYLHHNLPLGTQPWKTAYPIDSPEQKALVSPLPSGLEFDFRIRFDNLSPLELGSLVAAVRPFPDFHHKLGMGKPLGLGSISLQMLECRLVNRQRRYTLNGLGLNRDLAAKPEGPAGLANFAIGQVPPGIRNALRLLGQVPAPDHPVEIPTVAPLPPQWVQQNPELDHHREKNTYRWFMANDVGVSEKHQGAKKKIDAQRKCLQPIGDARALPTLERYQWTDPKTHH
jgi:CRISPR-associated protein (TIGR03986 family)